MRSITEIINDNFRRLSGAQGVAKTEDTHGSCVHSTINASQSDGRAVHLFLSTTMAERRMGGSAIVILIGE